MIQRLVQTGQERYKHGIWSAAYTIIGDFKQPSLSDLLQVLIHVEGHETGWTPWYVPSEKPIKPYAYKSAIECLIAEPKHDWFSDGVHSDFWRASPEGKLFLLWGYEDDGNDAGKRGIEPDTVFDFVLPVWRVGECLLHAHRLGTRLASQFASVLIWFTWERLANRLSYWASSGRHLSHVRRCYQNSVTSELLIPAGDIVDQLPEAVKEVTSPLYEAFDFFDMPIGVIREEIQKMRV